MTRLNVSMKNNLVKMLEESSERNGKTVSSILSEASQVYVEAEKLGIRITDVMKGVKLIEIMKQINAVPVPGLLLDRMINISFRCSQKETSESWFERGRVLGNIMKAYAETMSDFSKFVSDYSVFFPVDVFEVNILENRVNVVLSGVGYDQQAAICTAEGISGFLSAYGYGSVDSETSQGFVKVSAEKETLETP